MNHPKIFIISGPSGVGKDTVIKGILKKFPDLVMVKSYTTRPPRKSDEVGNRIFVAKKQFKKMIKKGEMIEWQKVHSWYYGRKKEDILKPLNKGKSVIIEVDVVGAKDYKKIFPDAVLIFIKYQKPAEFIQRLKENRPETSKKELEIRQKSLKKEIAFEKYYAYSVVNPEGHPEKALEKVSEIISDYTPNV